MSYSREYRDSLLSRADIVAVVGLFISLKKRGRSSEYVGLCPNHKEEMASFVVHATKQFYHCFGCGIHGNVIDFLMKYREMTYQQTVMWLARQYRFYPKEWARQKRRAKAEKARIEMKEVLRM
jgi:DNA primase